MSKDLYVKNIAREISEEELRKLFAVCGKVTYVHMVKNAQSGEFLGCAYVKMASEAEAKDAIVTLDGARLGNREIVVVEALPQRPAGNKGPTARNQRGAGGDGPGRPRTGPESRSAEGQRRPADATRKGPKRPAGEHGRPPGRGPGKNRRPGTGGGGRGK